MGSRKRCSPSFVSLLQDQKLRTHQRSIDHCLPVGISRNHRPNLGAAHRFEVEQRMSHYAHRSPKHFSSRFSSAKPSGDIEISTKMVAGAPVAVTAKSAVADNQPPNPQRPRQPGRQQAAPSPPRPQRPPRQGHPPNRGIGNGHRPVRARAPRDEYTCGA